LQVIDFASGQIIPNNGILDVSRFNPFDCIVQQLFGKYKGYSPALSQNAPLPATQDGRRATAGIRDIALQD
jgi:hypothetical protein